MIDSATDWKHEVAREQLAVIHQLRGMDAIDDHEMFRAIVELSRWEYRAALDSLAEQ